MLDRPNELPAPQNFSRIGNKPPKRSKTQEQVPNKILKKDDLKSDETLENLVKTESDSDNNANCEIVLTSPKIAWTDNNANMNENNKKKSVGNNETLFSEKESPADKIAAKKETCDLLKQKRMEMMKIREKRSEFSKFEIFSKNKN